MTTFYVVRKAGLYLSRESFASPVAGGPRGMAYTFDTEADAERFRVAHDGDTVEAY